MKLLILTLCFFLTLLTIPNLVSADYLESCNAQGAWDQYMTLTAYCRKYDESYQWTQVALGRCIANDDGHLVWRAGGGADQTCANLVLIGDRQELLSGYCLNRRLKWVFAQIDLSKGNVENINGDLWCQN